MGSEWLWSSSTRAPSLDQAVRRRVGRLTPRECNGGATHIEGELKRNTSKYGPKSHVSLRARIGGRRGCASSYGSARRASRFSPPPGGTPCEPAAPFGVDVVTNCLAGGLRAVAEAPDCCAVGTRVEDPSARDNHARRQPSSADTGSAAKHRERVWSRAATGGRGPRSRGRRWSASFRGQGTRKRHAGR